MAEWDDLTAEAERLPHGRERSALLQRAIDAADAVNDLDAGFSARVDLVEETYHSAQPLVGLAAFGWCLARLDEEPERFAQHGHRIGWMHKWMPNSAVGYPTVSIDRLVSMVDDLERRHLAEGAGRRQALAARILLHRQTGVGVPLEELFADWRASARSSLSDCHMCEVRMEAQVLVAKGQGDEALAVLQPFLDGEVRACADGPAGPNAVAIPLLLERGRGEDAARAWGRSLRSVRTRIRKVEALAELAELLARAGDASGARDLVAGRLAVLDELEAPSEVMYASASFARALAGSPPEVAWPATSPVASLLGDEPAGGWTTGTVAAALEAQATALAARFDQRNGNTWMSGRVADTLAAPDLPPAALRPSLLVGTGRTSAAPPASAPSSSVDPEARPATSARPPEPLAADAGPEELDRWARAEVDAWHLTAVAEAARTRWDDPSQTPPVRAVAGVWLADPAVVDPHELLALAAGGDLGPGVECRVRGQAALDLAQGGDPDRARTEAHAARLVARTGAGLRPRAAALRVVFDVAVALDDRAEQDAVRAELADLVAGIDDTAHVDGLAARVVDADLALRHALVDGPPEAIADAASRLLEVAVDWVATSAREVSAPAPGGVVAVVDATRALADHGRPEATVDALDLVARTLAHEDEARPLRFQVLLQLADLRSELEGPEAAMVPQRAAIDAVRDLGPTPMLGWARRGLGHQLRAAGRLDEAVVQYAEATELLADAGDLVESLLLVVARAWCELDLGAADRAADLTDAAIDHLGARDDIEDEARGFVLRRLLDVAASAASAVGDHALAATHLVRLADLSAEDGHPDALARSLAAQSVARSGDLDRALALLAQAEDELDRVPEDRRTIHRAVVWGRRAEVLWWVDRNTEAAELALEAVPLADAAGDPELVAWLEGLAADARHDDAERSRAAGDPDADALDALAELAYQRARASSAAVGDEGRVGRLDERATERRGPGTPS